MKNRNGQAVSPSKYLEMGSSLSSDFTGNIHDGTELPPLKAVNQRRNSAFLFQSLMTIWLN